MIPFSDDQIDLFAQTAYAGFHADGPRGWGVGWDALSPKAKGDWRRAVRALLRHVANERSTFLPQS